MKFRDLKHKKFYWYFSEVWYKEYPGESCWWDTMPESYVVNDENGLCMYAYWEDDREYCGGSGYTKEKYTWKELKKTIKEQGKDKRYNDLRIFTGKCERCGCKLTPENYEYKLDITRQKSLLRESTNLREGLRESYCWYKNNKDKVNRKAYLDFINKNFE